MKLKVKCPAKINLTLHVFKKDPITGFHPIESIMQTVSLCDYLTIETTESNINFNGNSKEITYDSSNLVIKALEAYFNKAGIKKTGLNIYLEKNIPIAAGLAGGSTDAAGMILALNEIFKALSYEDIFKILADLGSDLNFCYIGGRALCKGKGDDIEKLPFEKFDLSVVKPKDLKISTKKAYEEFDKINHEINMPNYLEFALIDKIPKLNYLHNLGFQMSGSGPSFFTQCSHVKQNINREDYEIFENLVSLEKGVCLI